MSKNKQPEVKFTAHGKRVLSGSSVVQVKNSKGSAKSTAQHRNDLHNGKLSGARTPPKDSLSSLWNTF